MCADHTPANWLYWNASLRRIADPAARMEAALDAAYAYYERNERMMDNVLRDAAVMPVGGGFVAFQSALAGCMSAGWVVRGRRRERLRAALGLAADFRTWQLLARGQGLTRREVTALMTGLATGLAGRTRDDLSEER